MLDADALGRIRCWIFDLDNTLYPFSNGILEAMHSRAALFIAEQLSLDLETARALKDRLQKTHGTAARGLQLEHGIAPERFQDFVHDLDLTALTPSRALLWSLRALPGRRFVHTNAPPRHARAVISRLGIGTAIDGIADITTTDQVPKPAPAAYDRLLKVFAIDPLRACMFEDQAENLVYPAALGMTTVLVSGSAPDLTGMPHVHHVIADLADFLVDLNGAAASRR